MEDSEITAARSGDNIRLRLKNVEEEDISPGFVLCIPARPIHTVMSFEAQLVIVEHKSIICAGYAAVMHAHAAVEEITMSVCFASCLVNALSHCSTWLTKSLAKRPRHHQNS